MVSTILDVASATDHDCDLHILRSQRTGSGQMPLRDVDTFEGVVIDPQSLHKYNYTPSDPVNYTDPTGMFSGSVLEFGFSVLNTINASIRVLQAVSKAKQAADFITSAIQAIQLLNGGIGRILGVVKDHIAQVASDAASTKAVETMKLFEADFWEAAAKATAQAAADFWPTVLQQWSGAMFTLYRKSTMGEPFQWVIYAPTPVEKWIPNPSRFVSLPRSIEIAGERVLLKFGGGGKDGEHRGRVWGLGYAKRNGSVWNDTQIFRLDYHTPSSSDHLGDAEYAELMIDKYAFNYHVRKAPGR